MAAFVTACLYYRPPVDFNFRSVEPNIKNEFPLLLVPTVRSSLVEGCLRILASKASVRLNVHSVKPLSMCLNSSLRMTVEIDHIFMNLQSPMNAQDTLQLLTHILISGYNPSNSIIPIFVLFSLSFSSETPK